MNTLIVPDLEPGIVDPEVYNRRVREITLTIYCRNPKWMVLSKTNIFAVVQSPGEYPNKTFIVPQVLVDKQNTSTSENKLVIYMFHQARNDDKNHPCS